MENQGAAGIWMAGTEGAARLITSEMSSEELWEASSPWSPLFSTQDPILWPIGIPTRLCPHARQSLKYCRDPA